jgi:serine/threonine-protein kinase
LKGRVDKAKPRFYEFGDFRLDAERRLLSHHQEPVPLTPKAFDTLLYLVEHRGSVLSKDELMAAVWPDTTVEENNLGQNISKLRAALGENRGENRYIATAPGHGYRFVAEVTTPVSLRPPDAGQARRGRRLQQGLFVVAIAVALGVGASLWQGRSRPAADAPIRTVAVLPFKPLVVESRDEALELGMADTLITKLGSTREIVVRPIGAVRRYGAVEQDPVAAGRALGVEAVLDGTIQRWGDRVRVTARLLRVGDGRTLWAGRFDEKFGDVFAVQDSISGRVALELAPRLTGEERERVAKRYTKDAEAYDAYLKGRFFWAKRTLEGTRQAVEYFERALERDPAYALAYAGLGDCHRRLPIMIDAPSREAFPKAKAAALKALEIDGRLAEAHATLGWIAFWYEWDWPGAERAFLRALEIDPHHSSAHLGYGHIHSMLGRHEEALAGADRALQLEPLSSFSGSMKGVFLFYARRYPEAVSQLNRTLEVDPRSWITQVNLGSAYERIGRYEDALAALDKARESNSDTAGPASITAYVQARSGHRAEAVRILGELRAMATSRYVPPYNMAVVLHGMGNSHEALRLLEAGYEQRDVRMVFLGVDPKWDSLRTDPRFQSLLRRMKLSGN